MGFLRRAADRLLDRAESKAEDELVRRTEDAAEKAVETVAGKLTAVKLDVKGKIVKDFDDFKAKWEQYSRQPEKSVLYFLIALQNRATDELKGEAMASLILPTNYLSEDAKSPSGFKVNPDGEGWAIWDMWSDPITVQSYLGGKAKEDYKLDADGTVVLRVVGKAQKGREAVIEIASADDDTKVMTSLKRNKEGQWKIFTMTSEDVGKVEQEDF